MEQADADRRVRVSGLIGAAIAVLYSSPVALDAYTPAAERGLHVVALLASLALAWRLTRHGSAWLRVLGIPGITMLITRTLDVAVSFARW